MVHFFGPKWSFYCINLHGYNDVTVITNKYCRSYRVRHNRVWRYVKYRKINSQNSNTKYPLWRRQESWIAWQEINTLQFNLMTGLKILNEKLIRGKIFNKYLLYLSRTFDCQIFETMMPRHIRLTFAFDFWTQSYKINLIWKTLDFPWLIKIKLLHC